MRGDETGRAAGRRVPQGDENTFRPAGVLMTGRLVGEQEVR